MISDSGIVICVFYVNCSLLVPIRSLSDFSSCCKSRLCAAVGYMGQLQMMACYKLGLLWLDFERLVPLCYQSALTRALGSWHPQLSKDQQPMVNTPIKETSNHEKQKIHPMWAYLEEEQSGLVGPPSPSLGPWGLDLNRKQEVWITKQFKSKLGPTQCWPIGVSTLVSAARLASCPRRQIPFWLALHFSRFFLADIPGMTPISWWPLFHWSIVPWTFVQ